MVSIALYTAGTGMGVASFDIDTKAHNVANITTKGFKKWMTISASLDSNVIRRAGVIEADNLEPRPVGVQVGLGARVIAAYRMLSKGNADQTGNALDLMIQGAGYFAVAMPNGRTGYTRNGAFQINRNRDVTTVEGMLLEPNVNIPIGIAESTIVISKDGIITGTDATGAQVNLGQVEIYTFPNEKGLEDLGSNLLGEGEASGGVIAQTPGENNTGEILQKALESSNVEPTTEISGLIMSQRAYELNAKVMKAADESMKVVNDIKA